MFVKWYPVYQTIIECPNTERSEVIICYAPDKGIGPYIVTDPNNEGTYNYGPGTGINHFLKDVLPYWLWKNSEEDTTNWHERMFGN